MPNLALEDDTPATLEIPRGTQLLALRNSSGATIYYRLGDVEVTADTDAETGGLTLLDGEERWFSAHHGHALPSAFSFIQSSGGNVDLAYDLL